MGIPWGFPQNFAVGIGWVWGLKSNPHGSPGLADYPLGRVGSCLRPDKVRRPVISAKDGVFRHHFEFVKRKARKMFY